MAAALSVCAESRASARPGLKGGLSADAALGLRGNYANKTDPVALLHFEQSVSSFCAYYVYICTRQVCFWLESQMSLR